MIEICKKSDQENKDLT